MSTITRILTGVVGTLLVVGLAAAALEPPKADKEPAKDEKPKKTEVGKNVYLEVEKGKDGEKRRVLIDAYVCLREGQLEQLLTRKQTKEHESILAADVDARHIHAALLLAGAKPGSPVKFEPKFQPATGSTIKVTLQYEEKGKTVTVPARQWVRKAKDKKDLDIDWVFGGSRLVPNRVDPKKPEYYLANDGDVICVSNFESAMLDLPIDSSKDNAELVFEANTDRIPAKDTKVTIILEPVADKK